MDDRVENSLPDEEVFAHLPDHPTAPIRYDHSTPPHRVSRIKVNKHHPNRLAVDIHVGFCRFYADRGVFPPAVSLTFLEESADLMNWIHVCETKGWLPLPYSRHYDRSGSPWD